MTHKSTNDSELLFWIGMIVLVLSLIGFFVSSSWISEWMNEMFADLERMNSNDSDAMALGGTILFWTEFYILQLIFWLKGLPIWAKIGGIVVGGWLSLSNSDY